MSSETVVFGSGCFWCTEAVFKMIRGVLTVTPGYAGGTTEHPSYMRVAGGTTGHAEVTKVEYDPTAISFHDLLTVFFGSHDATQVNRQGYDIGSEYRSIILYSTDAQRDESEAFIKTLNNSTSDGKSIATEVAPLGTFYEAEQEHLDFYAKNRDRGYGYCQVIIEPKLQHVQQDFANLLKTISK
jgi:peptide-methionine (S)-S-oxide reductase